ncbi:hypothetical protein HGO38_06400 [Rhizobium sp. CG5]|uniref:hypothetical protein n=1 Tax=Rhizobium sp. CG5 TaxID=2726076 RepID=UPI00203414ED|nr:hypothetical protein [Rhizobium sp. CG5]MCM2473106.1 hypothetical protein [Rhizobium sp. CG5]
MLFGQSLFQSVLQRLEDEAAEAADDDTSPSHRISGLGSGFVWESAAPSPADVERTRDLYLDLMPEETAPPEEPAAVAEPPPIMPDHLARTAPMQVAEDLALSPADTLQILTEKRRSFARANHPDGVADPFRDKATRRMQIANLLIDEAIARLG